MGWFDDFFNNKPKQPEKKGLSQDEIEAIQSLELQYPVITPEDIEKAQKELEEQVSKEKLYRIKYLLSTGEVLLSDTIEHRFIVRKELVWIPYPLKGVLPRKYYQLHKDLNLSYDRAYDRAKEFCYQGQDAIVKDRVISKNFIVSREVVL